MINATTLGTATHSKSAWVTRPSMASRDAFLALSKTKYT